MLKQKLKYFLAGFIVAVLLLSSLTVFGESIEKTIKVVYMGTKVYVNGKLADLKDAQGNKVEPFAYNGTNYLPVRAISEALKQNVDWDPKNNAIWIGQRPDIGSPNIWLSDLDYFAKNGNFRFGKVDKEVFKDNAGNAYQDVFWFNGWGFKDSGDRSSITYLLNGKYKRFKATYVLPYENKDDTYKCVLRIYGDDEVLYTSQEMTAGSLPENIDLDVSNVIKLTIECYDGWGYTGYWKSPATRALVNAGLYE